MMNKVSKRRLKWLRTDRVNKRRLERLRAIRILTRFSMNKMLTRISTSLLTDNERKRLDSEIIKSIMTIKKKVKV